jgi:hypothetical protein
MTKSYEEMSLDERKIKPRTLRNWKMLTPRQK